MRLPKTIIAIPIILMVLTPFIYSGYFQVRQRVIAHEMEERMEEEQLQTIRIPVQDFRWYKKNKEVVVNGKMFDVKSMTRSGDHFILTGLYDEQETELHLAIAKMQNERREGNDAGTIYQVSHWLAEPVQLMEYSYSGEPLIPSHNLNPAVKLYFTPPQLFSPPPERPVCLNEVLFTCTHSPCTF